MGAVVLLVTMKLLSLFVTFIFIFHCVNCLPAELNDDDFEDRFQDDINLTEDQRELLDLATLDEYGRSALDDMNRNAVKNVNKRWPDNIMPFSINETAFGPYHRKIIMEAVDEMNFLLSGCFVIKERTDEKNWVAF